MATKTASTESKYIIRRHARAREPLPSDTVKIARPKPLPPAPTKPNVLTMLPTVFMALSVGAISFFVNRGSSMGTRSVLTIIPMVLMGVMMITIQLWVHRGNVKKHKAQLAELDIAYQKTLLSIGERLELLAQKQQRISHRESPPPAELLKRVLRRDKSLWERQPNDNDFLGIRLGAGKLPFSVTIKAPEQEGEDPRLAPALQLASEFDTVEYLPIVTNLNWLGTVGVRSHKPNEALYLAYTMVANIVTHHSPDEVYLYLLSHRHDAAERWGWLRWLPHTNALRDGQGGVVRLSFAPGPTDEEVLLEIAQILRQRGDDKRRARRMEPHLVIIFDNTPTLQGHQVMGMLLGHDPGKEKENLLQASAVFVQNPIPPQVNAMIEVQGAVLEYRETWMSDASQIFHRGTTELATAKQVEQLARSMAPLRTEASYNAGGGNLPGSVRLVELLGATQPQEVNLDRLYSKTYDPKRVMTFPIGLNLDLKPQIAVLRDTFAGEVGAPHTMLAGMTGQGKSILLQAMVLSLALTHPPLYLNFILADFKGEGELAKLRNLPHVAGFVTDLANSAAIERFRVALSAEVDWRKAKLASMTQKVTHIRDYNKYSPDNPLPHLVIVIDEFAYGLQINPEFRETIDLVAKQGRTLGMHLILSTQRAADFDSKIRSNVGIRISLRVNSKEDSKIMLDRDEAFTKLKRPGQAYIQVGDNEIFEMFQAARADIPYQSEGTKTLELVENFTIYRVMTDGRRHKEALYKHQPKTKNEQKEQANSVSISEAEVLVSHIRAYCSAANYRPVRQIALPPLPMAGGMPLLSLLANQPVYSRWHGNGWAKETRATTHRLRLPVGMIDLPAQQDQRPYIIDFNQGDGNLMVAGPVGTGKSLLLRTLVLGLALTHTPAEVNFYILSRGAALTFCETLPHCQGNVIRPEETERLSRLFAFLEAEINRRQSLIRETLVDNITALRQERPELTLPALFLIIEDYAGFRADHDMALAERLDQVLLFAREGSAVDLHLVVSSNDTRSTQKLRDNIRQRMALGLKSVADYMDILDKRVEVLPEVEGRGYLVRDLAPLECQIAAPTPEPPRSPQEVMWLKEVATAMNTHWPGYRPLPVVKLPTYVELTWLWTTIAEQEDEAAFLVALHEMSEQSRAKITSAEPSSWNGCLPSDRNGKLFGVCTASVGIEYKTQLPFAFELMEWGTYSLVVGPTKSGKSDLLLTFCLAAAANLSPSRLELVILDFGHPYGLQPLARLPHVRYASNSKQAKQNLTVLLAELEQRVEETALPQQGDPTTGFLLDMARRQTIIVIDDLLLLFQKGDGELFKLIDDCTRIGQEVGLNLLIADTSQNLGQARQMQQATIMVQHPNGPQMPPMTQPYQVRFAQAAFLSGRGVALTADTTDASPLTPQARMKRTVAQMNNLQIGRGRGVVFQQSEPTIVQFARLGLPGEGAAARRVRLKQVVEKIAEICDQETAVDGGT